MTCEREQHAVGQFAGGVASDAYMVSLDPAAVEFQPAVVSIHGAVYEGVADVLPPVRTALPIALS